jgi:hypothetical protein
MNLIEFEILTVVVTEDYCRLGCDAVYSSRNSPAFRKNISPSSSGSKCKPSRAPSVLQNFWLGILFDPEVGGH